MGFRDRFFTPATARAILSWRIALGVGVAVAAGLLGLPWSFAALLGVGVYAGSVLAAMPRGAASPNIDAFTLSEPWRQLVQGAQGAARRFRDTVDGVDDGPLRARLDAIGVDLAHGIDEAWAIAQAGDEIDDVVRRLDPTTLRSNLATAQQRAHEQPSPEHDAAVDAIKNQLESAERLEARSADTAATLRRTQAQLDEIVARAGEVRVGALDTDAYADEVGRLVVDLEALRQAVEETRRA